MAINKSIKNKFAVRTSSSTMGTFWTEQGHLIFHRTLLPQVSSLLSVVTAMLSQAFETIPGTPQEKCFSMVCYVTQDLRADTTARRRRTAWCCKESSTEKTPSCCCPWPWLQGSSSSTTERQQRGSGHQSERGSPTDSRAAAPCGSWALGSCTLLCAGLLSGIQGRWELRSMIF